ncbi:MAG: hypothetical protein IME99_05585 [Proteobacteria bacterium]|nr:hypothetical protein [Pseudomonadota bacterium]
MIHAAISTIFAFAIVLLAGRLVLLGVDPAGVLRLGRLSINALGLLFGLGALSLQLFFYSVAGLGVTSFSVALPWVVLLIALLLLYRTGTIKRPVYAQSTGVPTSQWGAVETVATVIIALQLVYVFVYYGALPITGWDAWSIWFFKARAFFIDGGVTSGFLLNADYGYDHPDYPLLVPLSLMWLFTTLGEANDIVAKILYPIQFAALLALLYYFILRSVGRRSALVAAALLSLTPLVVIHSAGLPQKIGGLYSGDFVGYADLTLALLFMASGGFIYLYAKEGAGSALRAAALVLAIGAWTKNEGVVFALLGASLLLLLLLLKSFKLPLSSFFFPTSKRTQERPEGVKVATSVLFIVAALALFVLPWALYKAHFGLGSEYTGGLNVGTIGENIGRLPFVLGAILKHLFVRLSLVSVAWWVLALSVALNLKGILRPGVFALLLLLIGQFAVYTLVYVITPADVAWQISTSLDRLVLHMTPLALLIAFLNGGGVIEERRCS